MKGRREEGEEKPFQSFHINVRLDCPFPNIDGFVEGLLFLCNHL